MRWTERTDRFLKTAAGPARWSTENAGRIVELAERSGDSVAAFCEKHGLSYVRVLRWRKRLRSQAENHESGPMLLPLRIVEAGGDRVAREDGRSDWSVELEFGGCRMRFTEGASEATMARALRAARELSC